MTTTDAREQQRALYGAPLGELAAEVMSVLGLTQGKLAQTLGLSAPMLSQLMSGQRVKIGNPSVVHRLQSLITLSRNASGLSADEVAGQLESIRDEQHTLTGTGRDNADSDASVQALAASATGAQLSEVAASADRAGADALAALLRRAAGAARG